MWDGVNTIYTITAIVREGDEIIVEEDRYNLDNPDEVYTSRTYAKFFRSNYKSLTQLSQSQVNLMKI
jgi:hypothetical protein